MILKGLKNIVSRWESKQIDASGLAIFRIFYAAILFCEICQIIYFRHLIYDKIPFLEPSEINVLPGLIFWQLSVLFVLFGLFTRPAAILNYVLSLVFIATLRTYEYHVFYAYMGMNFLFILLPVSTKHSLDRLIEKWKYSSAKKEYQPAKTVSVLSYYLPIVLGVGFVYFDSVFFKLASYNWTHGLGMWLPASLPMVTHIDATPFLNMKWLAIGLGYLTLVFETVFLFTFFRRKWRVLLFCIGAGLHIGITVVFPIPWFGLSILGIYILLVPVSFWTRLKARLKSGNPRLEIYYDSNCPLCIRTKILFRHFDVFNHTKWVPIDQSDLSKDDVLKEGMYQSMHSRRKGKIKSGFDSYLRLFQQVPVFYPLFVIFTLPGLNQLGKAIYQKVADRRVSHHCTDEECGLPLVKSPTHELLLIQGLSVTNFKRLLMTGFIALILVFQINATYHSKLLQDAKTNTGFKGSSVDKGINSVSKPILGIGRVFFGITQHGVFMDAHFDGYNHVLAVEAVTSDGEEIWLPIIKQDGTAGWYDYSFNWVKWTFRVMNNDVSQENVEKGIRDFGTFWAVKNGYDPKEVIFRIHVKNQEVPRAWEEDFLKKQKAKPWKMVGIAGWRGDQFVFDVPPIETIK